MDIVALLRRAQAVGLKVWVHGESLEIEGIPSQNALALVEELRHHKQELLAFLGKSQPGSRPDDWHAQRIARCVARQGICLFWSDLLGEVVAFIKDDSQRGEVPAGLVAYTSQELLQLFGNGQSTPSPHTLRITHEVKRRGGHITGYESG